MPGGAVRTVRRDGRWLNEVEGQPQPIDDVFERKEDAVLAGRDIARDLGVGHRVDAVDGSEPAEGRGAAEARGAADGRRAAGGPDERGPRSNPA